MAFDCVFRRVTFRPCNSDFKEQMQGRIVGALLRRSAPLARFVHKQFELLSWIFILLSAASLVWALWGGYNFYAWGSCNGRNVSGFCAFDPNGASNAISSTEEECRDVPPTDSDLLYSPLTLANYPTLHGDDAQPHPNPPLTRGGGREMTIIGDYGCDFTRKAWPEFKALRETRPDVRYTFIQFPVKKETEYLSDYATCGAALDKEKFYSMSDAFFAHTKEELWASSTAMRLVGEAGYDTKAFAQCLADPATKKATAARKHEVQKTGLYGTPTVFIRSGNEPVPTPLVGPKPARVYNRVLRGMLF